MAVRSPARLVDPARAERPRSARDIDPAFLALPLRRLADAALSRAEQLGADHADFRCERIRDGRLRMRDGRLQGMEDMTNLGFAVRVTWGGAWGFASGIEPTAEAARCLAEAAVDVARVAEPLVKERVELAAEPVYADVTWVSAYDVNPFDVPDEDKLAVLADWSDRLLAAPAIRHVDARFGAVQENKFYADLAGTRCTQQRVRVHPQLTAITLTAWQGSFEGMRTLAPPAARGWEYVESGWDWDGELARMGGWLEEKVRAPTVAPGPYDLVIAPSNLWLTIHETIGHATELDRALGYEAAYAGRSFATFDKLGRLEYGSKAMNVTGDRTAPHGLATIGFDDDGVASQKWDIVREGVLVGYQLDRRVARLKGFARSNGCAFADTAANMPIQRMANVSLCPAVGGPTTDELISGVKQGIYVVGDKSWSIDMERSNFQFTGQRFYKIRNGRLAGQLRDAAYQSSTTEFWRSMEAVGGPGTYLLAGADNCGKGQPLQLVAAGHGCPSALFRGVRILNTALEGSR